MRRSKSRVLQVAASAAVLLFCAVMMTGEVSAVVVGGWDAARGGDASLADSPATEPFRLAIDAVSPGATLTATSELTDSYLSTIDVLLVSAQKTAITVITPLSASEQTALFSFVRSGGNAVIFTEREPQGGPGANASRQSLVAPFGMTTTGDSPAPFAIILDPLHPIANGPFGAVTSFELNASGWFSDLGPYALGLAVETSFNQPVGAVIESGAIAPGSGRVIFIADGHTDPLHAPDLVVTYLNGLAYVLLPVPEPSTLVLAALGAIGLAAVARRKLAGR